MNKLLSILAIALTLAIAAPNASAMGYNVCVKTARHAANAQQYIQKGIMTADDYIAPLNNNTSLLEDTRKLLTYMYKYAEMRKDENKYDFENMAFRACLDFEPQNN